MSRKHRASRQRRKIQRRSVHGQPNRSSVHADAALEQRYRQLIEREAAVARREAALGALPPQLPQSQQMQQMQQTEQIQQLQHLQQSHQSHQSHQLHQLHQLPGQQPHPDIMRIAELESRLAQLREVNENLVKAKLKMSHLAHHDFLTNLPNRVQLLDRLIHAIALAYRHKQRLAVIFLDLDRFKTINDSLGHSVGDLLLQSVAQRLNSCVRTSDTVSRQGGDEFVILLSEIEHEEDAAKIARKILLSLAPPHHVGNSTLYVGCSLGISIYPADGLDAENLIRHADTAMYFAKHQGRNQYQFFRPEMNRLAVERQFIEGNLRHALDQGQFILHYQPKIELASGAISGIEALIRWQHPERGLVPPDQFVPVAEECGLIVPIDDWVLGQACQQARCWLDAGHAFGRIAVNLSAMEFHRDDLLQRVQSVLDATGLAPGYLELELTERVFVKDVNAAIMMLERLRVLGVHLAIDDFGTGFSSLSYLRRLPIDVLKIDQSFLKNITSDAHAATILNAVIGLGAGLKQRVIAEGVETEEQYRYLQRHHCQDGQGFFFSRPMGPEHLTRLLEERARVPRESRQ